jgi:endoglucanase
MLKRLLLFLLLGTVVPQRPHTSKYNYAEVLQKSLTFYYGQISGKLPDWIKNTLNWRADCCLNDGKDVGLDLTGGWFDAGDHVVFHHPMSFAVYSLALSGIVHKETYQQTGEEWLRLRRIVRSGLDFFLKCHPSPDVFWGQVGSGVLDHSWWGPGEFLQMPRPSYMLNKTHPGSDVAGSVSASFALGSILFEDDVQYSKTLKEHAVDLFAFADNYRGFYHKSIPDAAAFYTSSHYEDELLLGSLALYWATGNDFYKKYAYDNSRVMVTYTYTWVTCWDDGRYANVYLLWKLLGDKDAQRALEQWGDFWVEKVPRTPGGLAFLTGWGSLRYPMAAGFLMLAYIDTNPNIDPARKKRWEDFAVSQIEYALGSNPLKMSYLTGFGDNYYHFSHHRGSHSSHNNSLYYPYKNKHINWALTGGPRPDDTMTEDRAEFGLTEVANDMQVGLVGLSVALVKRFGGIPIPDFPKPEPVEQEYFVGGYIARQSSDSIQVNLNLESRSSWPPRSENLCFRYYLYLEQNNVEINSYYNEQADIGKLTRDNNNECIWYVPVCWKKGLIYPQSTSTSRKQAQITIHLPYNNPSGTFDRSKDPSFQGLTSVFQDDLRNIPVYENGKLMVGNEPKGVKCGAKPSSSPSSSPTPSPTTKPPSPTPVPTPPPTPPKPSPTPSPNPPNPPTPTPSPTPSTTCSGLWQQCGGKTWTGPTCCVKRSTCQVTNEYYSQCVPTNEPLDPSDPDAKCSAVWQQCGGKNYNGPTCCQSGSVCQTTNEYYSQCVPGEPTTPTTPTTPTPSPEPTPIPSPEPPKRRRICYECTLIRE